MKRIIYGALLMLPAMLLSSCNEEGWQGEPGTGGIRLSLRASSEVTDAVPQVRSGQQTLEAPDVELFGISLKKGASGTVKTWNSLQSFRTEKGFQAGTYTITAFYGDKTKEGFDLPYYEGSAEISVLESRETEADITATLANTMVSVEYSEAFRNYFADWNAQVHSEGHDYITYSASEQRAAYLVPGTVDVGVTVTNQNGKSVSLQPTSFTAEARHHYHITFDVNNGEVGEAQLVIKFDDTVVQDDVQIDLTEELFTTPAPEVKASGFTDGQSIAIVEGAPQTDYKYQVIARGGVQSVVLTVNSDNYTPAFGKELDLMTAGSFQREQLQQAGVDCAGLWKNPDRMALVNITDFCANLPEGKHKITLLAKDRYTRVSNAVSLEVDVTGVNISVKVADMVMGSEEAQVDITFNGENASQSFTFKVMDNYGTYISAPVKSVTELSTRAFESKTYRFVLQIPASERASLPVAVYYRGTLVKTVSAAVTSPQYTISVDPFARVAEINVTPDRLDDLNMIISKMRIYVGGQRVAESNLLRDAEKGRITLSGLKGSTNYHLQTGMLEGDYISDSQFTTETESGVPNGNFSVLSSWLNNYSINQGGRYKYLAHLVDWYQNKETLNVSEPTGWATVNKKTCNLNASVLNTWFVYPSAVNTTESGMNAMLIRSVGYDYSGTLPGDDYHSGKTYKYNANVPNVSNKAAGKLFLGSYNVNTVTMSETYNEGVSFTSRPAALKGNFRYNAVNNEKGMVTVSLYNGNTLVASGSGTFSSASSMTSFDVPLTYEVHGMPATQLRIMFCSSQRGSSDYKVETVNVPVSAIANDVNQSYIGSELIISNLTFDYGTPKYKAGAKKVVIRKNIRKR